MDDNAAGEDSRIQMEHDTLLQQAAHLSSTLARRRADLALMRAEAATVAISLEAAKQNLDNTLRDEANIRADASPSPMANLKSRADFLPDVGLIRALRGQLDVTRESIREALSKRDALLREIETLENSSRNATVAASYSPGQRHTREPNGRFNQARLSAGLLPLNIHQVSQFDPTTAAAHDLSPSPSATFEQSVLHLLDEGTSSRSSFRSDHAHIWRDNTMPNLILTNDDLPKENEDSNNGVILGVVTERVFERVACFTPTEGTDEKVVSKFEGRILEFSQAFRPTGKLCEQIVQQYGILRAPCGDHSSFVRVIAPKVALNRVCRLAPDAVTRPTMRRHVVHVFDESMIANQVSGSLSAPHVGYTDVLATPEERNDLTESDNVSEKDEAKGNDKSDICLPTVRKTNSSAVLNDTQFAQIMEQGVPARFHESSLTLLYSTETNGMSLRTLYNLVHEASPTIIAILDTRRRCFGCYAAQPWKASATRYYGSGESFVFGTDKSSGDVHVYKWSRANSFFQFTSQSFLAIGGGTGSHFALWVDEDLLMGTTSSCSTFASPPLTELVEKDDSSCNEFKILSLEVWGFRTGR